MGSKDPRDLLVPLVKQENVDFQGKRPKRETKVLLVHQDLAVPPDHLETEDNKDPKESQEWLDRLVWLECLDLRAREV